MGAKGLCDVHQLARTGLGETRAAGARALLITTDLAPRALCCGRTSLVVSIRSRLMPAVPKSSSRYSPWQAVGCRWDTRTDLAGLMLRLALAQPLTSPRPQLRNPERN